MWLVLSRVLSCSCGVREVPCVAHHDIPTTITGISVGAFLVNTTERNRHVQEMHYQCGVLALPSPAPHESSHKRQKAQDVKSCTTTSLHLTHQMIIMILQYWNRSYKNQEGLFLVVYTELLCQGARDLGRVFVFFFFLWKSGEN